MKGSNVRAASAKVPLAAAAVAAHILRVRSRHNSGACFAQMTLQGPDGKNHIPPLLKLHAVARIEHRIILPSIC